MCNGRYSIEQDFYVHESVQRQGVGIKLFETMIQNEKTEAKNLAYDRPSQKLLYFLKKHYQLSSFIPQNNNFVIYDDYFKKKDSLPSLRSTGIKTTQT